MWRGWSLSGASWWSRPPPWSAVSFYLYSAANTSIAPLSRRSFVLKLPRWSAHPCGRQPLTVLPEYSNFTESIISDHVNSVQRVNCREDIAAAERELFSTAEHLKSHAPAASACPCRYAAWVVSGGRRGKGVKDTDGSHRSPSLPVTLTPSTQTPF